MPEPTWPSNGPPAVPMPEPTWPRNGPPAVPMPDLGRAFGMGAAGSAFGVPVAAGGWGLFDPSREGGQMLAASMTGGFGGPGVPDPAWEQAVRQVMGLFG